MKNLAATPIALFAGLAGAFLTACADTERTAGGPAFEAVQPALFSSPGAQPNAWIDFDNDGDLDLFIGFRGAPNRLYRNDDGVFTDVAPEVGLADEEETRAAAWGDFDADGHLDLYIGFRDSEQTPNRLYWNEGDGAGFIDMAGEYGVDLIGNTRQTSWIDYDNDGDVDLFIAFREQPNRLFRNDLGAFADVSASSGIDDPRKTVGVAWFDMDQDGDLDAFVANQNGDQDGFYRNDDGRFSDIAPELGMDSPDRTEEIGGVGPAVVDYDIDGDLDLFVANYGPDTLWRNNGDGTFTEVGAGTVIGQDYHSTTVAWGDYDNDGWTDLFVTSYLSDVAEVPDHVFRNVAGQFSDVTPETVLEKGASHGVQWADFDADGDLDLALANNNNDAGTHVLYRNLLPDEDARRSIQVRVLDQNGRHTTAGSEVRVFESGTNRLLGTRLVDTGGGYCSQGTAPVHLGLPPGVDRVDIEVTVLAADGRQAIRVAMVDPNTLPGRVLEVRAAR
jgi:hypothetical protein